MLERPEGAVWGAVFAARARAWAESGGWFGRGREHKQEREACCCSCGRARVVVDACVREKEALVC